MNRKPLLEICVDTAESAAAAERGGADRVELSSNLLEGGVTPSAGMIAAVRKRVSIPLHVMIRPRGGDFCYSDSEFEAMKHDVDAAKHLGANGVVLGLLDQNANVDVERTRELVERARPISVTFHRAFDFVPDLLKSLDDVIRAGAGRILTSGGEARAEDTLAILANLVRAAQSRAVIMVCGGVRAHNIKQILEATQAREIHVGQSGVAVAVPSAARQGNSEIRIGDVAEPNHQRRIVSAEKVRELAEAL